ncbi:TPA: Protein argonaute-3, variant 2 [Trebouxia sp. C0004]
MLRQQSTSSLAQSICPGNPYCPCSKSMQQSPPLQQPSESSQTPVRKSSVLGSAVSVFGQAWMYITDEAAAVAAEGPDGLDRTAQHHMPMPKPHLHFNVTSQGGSVTCTNSTLSSASSTPIPASSDGVTSASAVETLSAASFKQAATKLASNAVLHPKGAYMQELKEAASGLTPRHAAPETSFSSASASQLPHSSAQISAADAPPDAQDLGSSPPHAFATFQWQGLHTELAAKAGKLDFLKMWLQEASVQRPVPSPAQHTSKDGDHPASSATLQDVLTVQAAHGIEHSALQGRQGQPLACHMVWKPQHGASPEHQVSVHVGSVTAVHVPGLITSIVTFAGLEIHKPQSASEIAAAGAAASLKPSAPNAAASEGSLAKLLTDQAAADTTRSESSSGLSLSFSVLGIGIGALSSSEPSSHAVWLTCSKLSAHLGQIRARGRPGSLVAGLLSMQKGPPPHHGLRVSAAGVQLGMIPLWSGITDVSKLWPAGLQEVTEPIEMQALLQGFEVLQAPAKQGQGVQANQPSRASTQLAWPAAPTWQIGHPIKPVQPDSPPEQLAYMPSSEKASVRLVTAASGAVSLKLTGIQLAMLASVAEAMTAETSRRFRQPLPQQAISPSNCGNAGKQAWLGLISIQTAPIYAMLTLDQPLQHVLAVMPAGLRSTLAHDAEHHVSDTAVSRERSTPAVAVLTDKLSMTLAVGPADASMPAVCITLVKPHAWASPAVKACIPACEVHMASVAMQSSQQTTQRSQDAASLDSSPEASNTSYGVASPEVASQQLQPVSIELLGGPLAMISTLEIAATSSQSKGQPQSGSTVLVGVQTVGLELEPVHIIKLVQFVQCTMLGPTIPVLPMYPPQVQAPSGRVKVQVQAQMVFGQLQVGSAADQEPESPPPDLAFWMTSPSFSYSKSTAEAPGAQCNGQGFYQLPTTTKALVLSVPNCTLATAAAFSQKVAEGAAAQAEGLQCVCRVAPSKGEDQFLYDSLLSLHYNKVERPNEDDNMDVVLMTRALHMQILPSFVQAAAGLATCCTHALKVNKPPDPGPSAATTVTAKATIQGLHLGLLSATGQQAQFQADDMILIVHNALGAEAQRLGRQGLQLTTMDLTLAAAKLTVTGPGLPASGLMVLMPADMHLSVSSSRPPTAITAALSASALPLNLSPAAVSCLMDIINIMSAAASWPHASRTESLPAQPSFTDSLSGMSVVSAEEQKHLSGDKAPPSRTSTDDLRCGLFSLTPVLASRPGPMQVSVGEEGPGYMPWHGSSESWVGWCYPYPRPVQVLCIQGGVALLGRAEVEVCCYVPDVDEYTPLACTVHSDAITGDLLIFVAETRPTLEWQLVCRSPSKEGPCSAKALLRHLLVNPPSLTTDIPPLQSVPLTVTVQVKDIRVHLLVETVEANHDDTASEELGYTVGMVYLTSLQAVLHKWSQSYAVTLCTRLALHYTDDLTLTEEVLLEPSSVSLLLEKGPSSSSTGTAATAADAVRTGAGSITSGTQADSLPLRVSEKYLSLPRSLPAAPGLSLHLRSGNGPLVLRIGQLPLDALHRSVDLASHSIRHYLSPSAKPPSPPSSQVPGSPSPQTTPQPVMSTPQQQQCGILISNMSPLDLLLGQLGTDEALRLPAKSDLAYCWHTAPGMTPTAQRLLHIACKPHFTAAMGEATDPLSSSGFKMTTSPPSSAAPSSPQSPLPQVPHFASAPVAATDSRSRSVLFPGEGGSRMQSNASGGVSSPGRHPSDLQPHLSSPQDTLLHDSNRPLRLSSSDHGLAWSESFDCTARSSCQVQLQMGNSQRCSVALCVHKVGLQWQVQLQASFVLVNHTAGTVHVHYTGQLADMPMPKMSHIGFRAGSPLALQPKSKEGEGGSCSAELMPLTTASGKGHLQVWLGSSQGWSLPVPLIHANPQVVLLRPGGLGEGSLNRPRGGSATAASTSPGMCCQLCTPDLASGQVSIIVWPLYSIFNALPVPLHWRLTAAAADSPPAQHVKDDWNNSPASLPQEDRGICQPGQAAVLAVAVEAGQSLSFHLGAQHGFTSQVSSADEPTTVTSNEAWSDSLMTHAAGSSNNSARLSVNQPAAVPAAGLWQPINIPSGQGNILSCMLVAQPGAYQSPMVSLCLVPHAVLHNSLPFPVCLDVPSDERQLPVSAGSSQALDWSSLSYRPKSVALAVTETQGNRLVSQLFAVDTNHDTQLAFCGNASSTSQSPAASSHSITFYAAARVHNEPFEIRPGGAGDGEGHTMEVTHISITPACFVTNLTQHQLDLQLQGQQPLSVGQQLGTPMQLPSTRQAQMFYDGQMQIQQQQQQQQQQQHKSWQLDLVPSQTRPVLNAWRHASQGSSHRPQSHPTAAALAVSVHLHPATDPSQSTPLPASNYPPAAPDIQSLGALHAVDVRSPKVSNQAESAESDLTSSTTTVNLMQASGRRHLLLTSPQQELPVLVACRSVLNQGRLHLVFFTDLQPPCVLHSTAAVAMAIMWCSLQRDKQGVLQEQCAEQIITLPAGVSLDCSPRSMHPGMGLVGEQEDEEAFLESITSPSGPPLPQLALKVKLHSADHWSSALLIKPGQHQAGNLVMTVDTNCASQHITLSLKGSHHPSADSGDATWLEPAWPSQQQQQLQEEGGAGMQLQVTIECLVISVWDDERRRLLGGPSQGRSAELCCICWDCLTLCLSRLPSTGGKDHTAGVKTHAEMTAKGLQIDSFCADSTHPVLLYAVPTADAHTAAAKQSHGTGFAISLQVCEAAHASGGGADSRSFCNSWIDQLALHLPPLAVAFDDSFMALVQRCVHHLASPALPSQGLVQATGHRNGPAQQGRADPRSPVPSWTPSATSPMNLLEQARQAKQLNDALDNFGAGRPTGTASSPWRNTRSPSQPGGASLVDMAAASAAPMSSSASNHLSPATPIATTPSSPLSDPQLPASNLPEASRRSAMSWADSQLSAELLAQSMSAAAPRLLLRNFSIAKVRLLFDIHVANGGPNIPFALDTHRAPLSVAGVGASRLLFQPSVMLHGLLAHALAEALLSAPSMLGSLDLLFNPTGLLQSLSQAWGDLLLGPLAAIEARSPSQFLVGLGAGGATFVRQLSAWTLGSIGGFSNASSRVLARALQTQPAARCCCGYSWQFCTHALPS